MRKRHEYHRLISIPAKSNDLLIILRGFGCIHARVKLRRRLIKLIGLAFGHAASARRIWG